MDEAAIRMQAIQFVLALRERWVGIPASELRKFYVGDARVPLTAQQGIFKPAVLSEPLSIRTALDGPYTDALDGSRATYAFSPAPHENDGLKRCHDKNLPLIYFVQTKKKPDPEYIVFAPVFVTGWNDAERTFTIELSERQDGLIGSTSPASVRGIGIIQDGVITKEYVWTPVQRRLHQARFRNAVLAAYRTRCAVCVLRIRPLLDGAHLVPDRDPKPTIVVSEGMALCPTHHRAFDAQMLRFDTNYRIRVELPAGSSVGDGEQAMLLDFDGRELRLPKDPSQWPRPSPH